MPQQLNFILPEQQTANINIGLTPPTSISGWTIQFDLMYRPGSPQPIISLFLASGYANGQSGITLVNGSTGVVSLNLNPSQVSGIGQFHEILYYQSYRTDSGFPTPLNNGFRLLTRF
jgi:hypothetical protein